MQKNACFISNLQHECKWETSTQHHALHSQFSFFHLSFIHFSLSQHPPSQCLPQPSPISSSSRLVSESIPFAPPVLWALVVHYLERRLRWTWEQQTHPSSCRRLLIFYIIHSEMWLKTTHTH